MECMCAQTRLRFILSSEGVFLEMESEPMLTSSVKSPLPETQTRIEPATLHHAGQRAQHTLDGATLAQIGDQKETSTERDRKICGSAEQVADRQIWIYVDLYAGKIKLLVQMISECKIFTDLNQNETIPTQGAYSDSEFCLSSPSTPGSE